MYIAKTCVSFDVSSVFKQIKCYSINKCSIFCIDIYILLHIGPTMAENVMWREAATVDQRKELLAKFFRSALAEVCFLFLLTY